MYWTFVGGFVTAVLLLLIFCIMPMIGLIQREQRDNKDLNSEINRLHRDYKEQLAQKCSVEAWYVHDSPIGVHKLTLVERDKDGRFSVYLPGNNCGWGGVILYDKAEEVSEEKATSWHAKALFRTPEEAYKHAKRLVEIRITRIRKQEEPWTEQLNVLSEELKALATPE